MFNQDNHSLKVNLGVGAYRNENRNPLIFNCFFDCFDTFEEIWGEF